MMTNDEEQNWRAVRDRDRSADGCFVYAVRSTGVYCRPGCPSRPARRENVTFYAAPAAAEAAGYRPCKRCRPKEHPGARVAEAVRHACALIEAAEEQPDLATLARAAGYSPSHFQRLFKAHVGLSPKQYAITRRKARLRTALAEAVSVTDAIYAAGFGASSRAYDDKGALGMTPGTYRNGAAGETIRFTSAPSSLGTVFVAATVRGICMIEFGDPETLAPALVRHFPKAQIMAADGDLAELVARVVARACATNTIAVAVPCHRVVGGSGDLSGYRWGVERKQALLAREGAETIDRCAADTAAWRGLVPGGRRSP